MKSTNDKILDGVVVGSLGLAAVIMAVGPFNVSVDQKIDGKNAQERAMIKGQEIAKIEYIPKTDVGDYSIEVIKFQPIEKGVEVYARAWTTEEWEPFIDSPEGRLIQKGEQIGFGKDGTVDIERFVIINPPILVSDAIGAIQRVYTLERKTVTKRLSENLPLAILQTLSHTISVKKEKFDSQNIVLGKVGNTTTTVFPDANPESTTVDGQVSHVETGRTWAQITAAAGNNATPSGLAGHLGRFQDDATTDRWQNLSRGIYLFDTSSIPDTDTISSAVLSFFGTDKSNANAGNTPVVNVYTSTPASNTDLVGGDFAQIGSVAQATGIAIADYSTSAYNDFTLNATGLGNISKTGVTKFATREATYDAAGVAPTWTSNGAQTYFEAYAADQAGTSNDPQLVAESSAAAAASGGEDLILSEE